MNYTYRTELTYAHLDVKRRQGNYKEHLITKDYVIASKQNAVFSMTRATLINSITKQNKIKLEQASWPAPASKFYCIYSQTFLFVSQY